MDMLNQLQKLVSGDMNEFSDAELARDIQAAYPAETETPTTPDLLLDRLLAQAEATPQLAPEGAVLAHVEEEPTQEEQAQPALVKRPWWARLFGFGRGSRRQWSGGAGRIARQFQPDLYHEYVEYHLRQVVNSASRMKPL